MAKICTRHQGGSLNTKEPAAHSQNYRYVHCGTFLALSQATWTLSLSNGAPACCYGAAGNLSGAPSSRWVTSRFRSQCVEGNTPTLFTVVRSPLMSADPGFLLHIHIVIGEANKMVTEFVHLAATFSRVTLNQPSRFANESRCWSIAPRPDLIWLVSVNFRGPSLLKKI